MFEHLKAQLERLTRRHDAAVLERMEDSLTGLVSAHPGPPMPLSWHPYYRGKTWLLDWLEGRMPVGDVVQVPVPPSIKSLILDSAPAVSAGPLPSPALT